MATLGLDRASLGNLLTTLTTRGRSLLGLSNNARAMSQAELIGLGETLLSRRGDVVYGSRYMGRGRHANQSWSAYLGGRSLSVIALACTGRYLTDTVTALKLFSRVDVAELPLETTGVELEHEITSRMLAKGRRIVEVAIGYSPRSREEGKKIRLRDWFIALRTFWRYGRSA